MFPGMLASSLSCLLAGGGSFVEEGEGASAMRQARTHRLMRSVVGVPGPVTQAHPSFSPATSRVPKQRPRHAGVLTQFSRTQEDVEDPDVGLGSVRTTGPAVGEGLEARGDASSTTSASGNGVGIVGEIPDTDGVDVQADRSSNVNESDDSERQIQRCEDDAAYAFTLTNGTRLNCAQLGDLCMNSTSSKEIQRSCLYTCKACEVGALHDDSVPCQDHPTLTTPVITKQHVPLDCANLTDYCQGYSGSLYISHKCPESCGHCTELGTWKEQGIADTSVPNSGCTRRRRWGFCAVRRRTGERSRVQ